MSRLIRWERSPSPVSVGVNTLWPWRCRESTTRRQHQPPCQAPCTRTKVFLRGLGVCGRDARCCRGGAKAGRKHGAAGGHGLFLLFAGKVQYCMDDQPALHHACSIVESRPGANVHVGDPLISAFSYESEVGVPLAMDISSAPGFRIQALSVLIFDSYGLIGCLTLRGRDRSQQNHGRHEYRKTHAPPACAFTQGTKTRANATRDDRVRDDRVHGEHAHDDRARDGVDVRARVHAGVHARGHGDAAAGAAAARVGPR
jgi:hypothetical protein